MKKTLTDILEIISNEKVFIVKETAYSNIEKGAEVYIDGIWCKWSHAYLERTLVHTFYTIDGYDSEFEYTSHSGLFLVKVPYSNGD